MNHGLIDLSNMFYRRITCSEEMALGGYRCGQRYFRIENMTETSQCSILRLAALRQKLQVSKATVYAWMNPKAKNYNPDFPLPIRLGRSTVGWLVGEVDAFLLKRMEERDSGRATQ